MSTDGRLELDELGEVIDHASTLDEPARTEVLDDGFGRSWAERLEDAGLTPWLRRHQVAVASVTAVCVLAAVGVIVVRALVPPPIDPELRVSVTPVVPSQYVIGESMQTYDQVGIFGTGAVLRSAYALTRQDPDDTSTYAITGLTGPGIRASTASRQPRSGESPSIEVARQDVDVVADCFDIDPPLPAGSYSLLVTRTDDRGRTLTGDVPLEDLSVNWPAYLTASCLGLQSLFALTPESIDVTADPGSHTVRADVTVSNTLRHAAIVGTGQTYGASPVVATLAPTTLSALRGGTLPVRVELRDCGNPALTYIGRPTFPGDERYDAGGQGIYLEAWFPSVELDPAFDPSGMGGRMQAPLQLTSAQAGRIDDALATLCEGAPSTSARVTDVGLGRTVTGAFPDGNATTTRLPVTLELAAPGADRVRVSNPVQTAEGYSDTTLLGTASAAVRGGRATVRTWLDADCMTGWVPPPVAQIEVTTAQGTFPFQLPINDTALTESLAVNCPSLPVQQLVEFGWADPRVP